MKDRVKRVATQKLERLVVNVPAPLFNDVNELAEYMNLDRTNFVRLALREFINRKRKELFAQTK